MRLGTFQLVFLVLLVIRAIATDLPLAPNETGGAGRRRQLLGVFLLSIVTTARWQRASRAHQRTSIAVCMRANPERLICA